MNPVRVRQGERFLAWAREVEARTKGERSFEAASVVYVAQGNVGAWLDEMWPSIFEAHLQGVHPVEATWPQERTLELFYAWFEISVSR